jgi:hypothetical protein
MTIQAINSISPRRHPPLRTPSVRSEIGSRRVGRAIRHASTTLVSTFTLQGSHADTVMPLALCADHVALPGL